MPERHRLLPECTRFTASDPFDCYFYHMPSDARTLNTIDFFPVVVDVFIFIDIGADEKLLKNDFEC